MRTTILTILLLSLAVSINTKICDYQPFCSCYGWLCTDVSLKSTSKPIDIKRYMGDWYGQFRIADTFEKSRCSHAHYELKDAEEGVIAVTNTGDDNGEFIQGQAVLHKDIDNTTSKFRLKFNFFARGEYWILDINDDYTRALIGGPCKNTLFLLARESEPMSKDELEIWIKKAEDLGYENFRQNLVFRKAGCPTQPSMTSSRFLTYTITE